MPNDTPIETDDATGADEQSTAETAERPTFTQADLDRILSDRLERQKKQLLKEVEKAKEDEANKQLEEAAEWQTLAEKRQAQLSKHEAKIAELESRAQLVEKYAQALDGYVAQLSDGLPEAIMGLLAPMDAAAKLEWLTANRSQFVQTDATGADEQQATADKRPSVPSTPPPQGSKGLSVEERRKRAARTF